MMARIVVWSVLIFPFFFGIGVRTDDGSHPDKQDRGPLQKFIVDEHGAIIRGDVSKKEIALVLTGDEFADGATTIRRTLQRHKTPASFFLTGNFYSNPAFKKLIRGLKEDGHYLGAHSDKHLLYADWTKRDSLLVTEEEFKNDLQANYKRMVEYGIETSSAPYFLPPYEWYNEHIARWTKELGFQLVNFTPGTMSTADYTYPQMGARYVSSDEIYQSVFNLEKKDPNRMNGFILLIHIGTDPRRTDKFYDRLDPLLRDLKGKGYTFVTITELLAG
ncbi:MAG: polysaccharide deacetylase family protein [Cyclobacteriaceae bacterium]